MESKTNTNEKEINLYDINKRIENEYCHKIAIELTDERLIDKYRECQSVKKSVNKLNIVLSKYVNEENKEKIIEDYLFRIDPCRN